MGFTTKANRIGLGLKVSKVILDEFNGQITVESMADELTKFSISLPASQEFYDEKIALD